MFHDQHLKATDHMPATPNVSFTVDANLDRTWRAIGISESERDDEVRKLADRLNGVYDAFAAEALQQLKGLHEQMNQCESEIGVIRDIYGPSLVPDLPSTRLSARVRLDALQRLKTDLLPLCKARKAQFASLQADADDLYTLLGVPENGRGEFKAVGETDLGPERLGRYKHLVASLQSQRKQRLSLFQALKGQIGVLSNELEESVSGEVQTVISGTVLTTPALDRLKRAVDDFEALKAERSAEIAKLAEELDDLYSLFDVDDDQRFHLWLKLSEAAITAMRDEIAVLTDEKEAKLPLLIRTAKREVARLCGQLRIPLREAARFDGGTPEEEARFLQRQVQELRAKKVEMQPILQLISQIGSYRDLIDGKVNQAPGCGGGSPKRVDEAERAKRLATRSLPNLERRLLTLLDEFKRRNDRDFEFGGVNYSELFTRSPSVGRARSPEPPISARSRRVSAPRQLLLDRMDRSLNVSASWSGPGRPESRTRK
jgi:hypothetical protein